MKTLKWTVGKLEIYQIVEFEIGAFNQCFLALFLLFSCGCGGGSSDSDSMIEGTWSGDLIQGGLTCADGMFIGACAGCAIGSVNLEVAGTDEIGSVVQANDGDCRLEGVRTSTGFSAAPVSGCRPSLVSIQFTLRSANEATISYGDDVTKVPVEPGQIACVGSNYADVVR